MNMSEMVKSLKEERDQIDITLASLGKISALASSNRQALTITHKAGEALMVATPHGTARRKATAGSGTHTKKRVITAEQRAEMSRAAKERWEKRKSPQKRATAKVRKQAVTVPDKAA
jgi:hypothetical protein